MTLLLKSVWRNVLRSNQLSNSSLRSTKFSNVPVTDIARVKPVDNIMMSIKTAPNSAEVLAAVQANLTLMTHKHLLQAFRSLFELQKASKNSDKEIITKDPTFSMLCQNLKKQARVLDVNEAIEAIKVLSFLKVPANSIIFQTMLQMIRSNINLMNTPQIMFLDFILTQCNEKNHLIDALKLALPLAFQIHLPLELDSRDPQLLREMLVYCCTHDLPDRCINNVVTGLLLNDQNLTAQMAKSIVWALCLTSCSESLFPTRAQLLHICCDILIHSIDDLTFDDVLRTAARLKAKVADRFLEYYNMELMDAIGDYVVDNDVEFEKALLVARVLSKISHTHLRLIEYLCKNAIADPELLSNARTNILFGFINCLSNNNFTLESDQWLEIKRQISENPILNCTNAALPWTKVCLELASLGHYEDKVLKKIFSKEFLDEYLARENNTLDYIQLLTLNEAVTSLHNASYNLPDEILEKAKIMYPIHALSSVVVEHLALGLGGNEFVARNVVLPSGLISDTLVCIKGGYPIKLPATNSNIQYKNLQATDSDSRIPIEQLNVPHGSIIVCILNFNQGCFSMNSNRLRGTFRLILDILEKQGYAAVSLNINEWMTTPTHERTPYLMREIGYKCGEMGLKLSAT